MVQEIENIAMPASPPERNGRLARSYLDYLPPLYSDDEFMSRFIHIFEDVLNPIEYMINNLELYLDPRLTPEPLLDWLAFWVNMALDPAWPLDRRRELVRSAAWLYRWRGTRKGLAEYLRIYTGTVPVISEYIPGMRLGEESRLGINTRLGSSGTGCHFTVTITVDSTADIDVDTVRSIIDSQKPAHTVYTLQINRQ
jgi:phage tail-like protein